MNDATVLSRTVEPLYPPTIVPPPQPMPLLRHLMRFVRNPLRSLPIQVYEQPMLRYGPLNGGLAWVTAPDLVERVLLKDADLFPKNPMDHRILGGAAGEGILTANGAAWRWQRRTVAPLFRPQALHDLVPVMSAQAEAQLEAWRARPTHGTRAVDAAMTTTTYNALTEILFSGDGKADADEIHRHVAAFLGPITWEIAAAMLRVPTWVWHPAKGRMKRSARALREIVRGLIQVRRAKADAGDDLLGRLMKAKDPETGQQMDADLLVDNVLTFMIAGHETTAKALTWTLYLLARSPEWQARVREEVLQVAGHERVGGSHLERLVVTRQVLNEGMRLYPPAPMISRITACAVELGGERLAAGTLIVMPIFVIHRHRKLWEDPDRFDPDRFLPEREARMPRTQFMPFGFGPRICVGAAFAMMEGVALLATLVRGARYGWDGRHIPEPMSRVTLSPRGGMPLHVEVL